MTFWLVFVSLVLADPSVDLPGTDRTVVFEDSAAGAVEDAMAALAERRFEAAAAAFGALADAGGNADARYLEALARYEAGDLSSAKWAAARGLERDGDHVALLSLQGLLLADQGRGDEALVVLAKAKRIGADDQQALERIAINERLVKLDRGEITAGGADDPLGDLAEELRRGDLGAAKKRIPQASESDRRGSVHRLLGQAAVARAEGRLDEAARHLDSALVIARKGGLVREQAASLAEIGAVYSLAGHYDLAVQNLLEAVGLVAGTSFRVNEVAFRAEAGRVATRLGQLDQARAQLAAARKVVPEGTRFPGVARLDELAGSIAAREGKAAEANAAFERAVTDLDSRGYWADSARVAAAAVELNAQTGDKGALKKWKARALNAFEQAGDPVGPAHVQMSLGLGLARAKDFEGAMAAFAEAATVAEGSQTARGVNVGKVARANAAEALVVLGHSRDAANYDLGDAVAAHEAFAVAESNYASGLEAYENKQWPAAHEKFSKAQEAFDELGEGAYAMAARRGLAWTSWNAVQVKDPQAALPVYAELEQEGIQIGDPELELRAGAAHAIALARSGEPNPDHLKRWAHAAEGMAVADVAVTCWAELAEHDETLAARARAARHAHVLQPGNRSAYALYSVSIDAYNEGDFELAQGLATDALPNAPEGLESAIQEVIDGAAAARQ